MDDATPVTETKDGANEQAGREVAAPTVDCPWCGSSVELPADAPALRCAACGVTVAIAPDPVPVVTLRTAA